MITVDLAASGKCFLVDHGGPERSWSTTQHHGPAGAPGPPLDHLDPAWTTSCSHTPEIAVQGGSRWTRGTTGTMELGGRPGVLWSHFYILLMGGNKSGSCTAPFLQHCSKIDRVFVRPDVYSLN